LPATVEITDAHGTWTATWSAGYGAWFTSTITGFGTSYSYEVGCHAANKMFINRYWGVNYSSSGFVTIICGHVSWSGTLTLVSGTGPDPGAGTTTFSQTDGLCVPQGTAWVVVIGCYPSIATWESQLGGVTINIWTDSSMTDLLATATSPPPADGGYVYAPLSVDVGTVYLQLTGATRFVDYTESITVPSTGISVAPEMTPAAGYYCFGDADDAVSPSICPYPLPGTLHCTFPAMSPTSVTFTYVAGFWTSSFSWSGHAYVLTLAPNADMTGTRDGIAFATGTPAFSMNPTGGPADLNCPVTGPFLGYIGNSTTPTDPGYELDPTGLLAMVTE